MSTRSAGTRDLLIQTALKILFEGEEVLTVDAVVRRSSISKGGLIHHFPNMDALVEAVIAEIIRQFENHAGQLGHSAEQGSRAEAEAYIDANLQPAFRIATSDLARGLIRLYGSDFRHHAPFLDPWRKLFANRLDRFRDADPQAFARSALLMLALESLVLVDVFNLYPFTEPERDAIKQELLDHFQEP